MQNNQTHTKAEARRIVKSRLNSLSEQRYDELSQAVYQNLVHALSNLQATRPCERILSYEAQPSWREVGLRPLEREFSHAKFDYAPTNANALLPTSTYDLVLVPVLGFNHENYRLGHGGGWYDKLLSVQPHATKLGVGFTLSTIGFISEPHDIRLDMIITEYQHEILQKRNHRRKMLD